MFVGGAAASAGGLALLVAPPEEQAGIRACLVGGAALELGALRVMKLRLDRSNAGGVYHDGHVRTMNRTAELATTAGVVLTLAGRRHRILALAGGMLTLVGALAERFAIVDAGRASARDPAAVVAPQLRRSGSAPGPGLDRYSGLGRLAPG